MAVAAGHVVVVAAVVLLVQPTVRAQTYICPIMYVPGKNNGPLALMSSLDDNRRVIGS